MATTSTPVNRPRPILALLGFFVAAYAVAGVSSVFTVAQIPGWYATLAKPSFNPPNQVFGPVWTVLYTAMAIAAWRIWRLPASTQRSRGLLCFWVQLALNFAWSFLFFDAHRIGFAAIEIILLWVAILATTLYFWRLDRAAGILFGAYLAWVGFATALNLAIWSKN